MNDSEMATVLPRSVFSLTIVVGVLSLSVGMLRVRAQAEAELGDPIELEEVFSIGGDEDAPVEYLFSNAEFIRTDGDGRIYIAERSGTMVRVYDAEGDHLGTLGRNGRGPGEFVDVRGIAIDADGRLVLFDRMLQRFTRFASFESIESFPVPDPGRVLTYGTGDQRRFTPFLMYGLADGHFLLFQRAVGQHTLTKPRIHVYDGGFNDLASFGAPQEWPLPNDEVTRHLMRAWTPFDAHHVPPGSSSLVLAPKFYGGRLFKYVPDGDTTWSLRQLEGRPPGHPTHSVLLHDTCSLGEDCGVDVESGTYGSFSSTTPDRMNRLSQYRTRSGSHGIGQMGDGRVVYLSDSEDDNGVRQLQLEIFDADGTLERVGRIERFLHGKTDRKAVNEATNVLLRWVDRRDRLYLVDFRSGFPVIRVMKLEES